MCRTMSIIADLMYFLEAGCGLRASFLSAFNYLVQHHGPHIVKPLQMLKCIVKCWSLDHCPTVQSKIIELIEINVG